MSYNDKLKASAEKYRSIVCMGIDPVIEALPVSIRDGGIRNLSGFYKRLFSAMQKNNVFPGAFKPNQGFFIKHDRPLKNDFAGSQALATIIKMIRDHFPEIPVILDYKRADISTSSENYAMEGFTGWGADAVTISPFMGTDSVEPFIDYCGDKEKRGVYILNRNSNKGSADFQNLIISEGEEKKPFYMAISSKIKEWAKGKPGVGAVVGATSLDEFSEICTFFSGCDIPLLIPGVGAQGGSSAEITGRLKKAGFSLNLVRINSSSGITHPWHKDGGVAPSDWERLCVNELAKLNREIDFK